MWSAGQARAVRAVRLNSVGWPRSEVDGVRARPECSRAHLVQSPCAQCNGAPHTEGRSARDDDPRSQDRQTTATDGVMPNERTRGHSVPARMRGRSRRNAMQARRASERPAPGLAEARTTGAAPPGRTGDSPFDGQRSGECRRRCTTSAPTPCRSRLAETRRRPTRNPGHATPRHAPPHCAHARARCYVTPRAPARPGRAARSRECTRRDHPLGQIATSDTGVLGGGEGPGRVGHPLASIFVHRNLFRPRSPVFAHRSMLPSSPAGGGSGVRES